MKKNLVLVGGGHAHMLILENIHRFVEKGYRVTVIGPSDYHYYSGMGPGMLGRTYTPADIRFATRDVVEKQGGVFLRDYAVAVDPVAREVKTLSGQRVRYDVVSCNAGSAIPQTSVAGTADRETIYPVKPIEQLMAASERLALLFGRSKAIVSIVGGGPSAAEVAGNVWGLARDLAACRPVIRIFCRSRFMGRFSGSIRRRVRSILTARNIEIHEQDPVQTVTGADIILASGKRFDTDFTFLAAGVRPSGIFAASGLPVGPDGGLTVNRYLQSVAYPSIFGGGDCIWFADRPLDKVGVYAVRQNPVLYHNLMAFLEGRRLIPFDPGPDYLLIFNLGAGQGVLRKGRLEFSGRLAFQIKDYIDTRFMKRFQAIEKNP